MTALTPIASDKLARAITAMKAVIAAEDACGNADCEVDYGEAIVAAVELCRAAVAELEAAP